MAKQRKSRTARFLNTKPSAKLPTPEEVNQVVARVTGKEDASPKNVIAPEIKVQPPIEKAAQEIVVAKRVPLTTAITPENRAKLEVASINGAGSVADMLNEALEYYFEHILVIEDVALVDTFKTIYARKVK